VACNLQIIHVFISLPKASQLLFAIDQYEVACEVQEASKLFIITFQNISKLL
jgi:hypothetical protein